jgi:hypothetical protein
VELHYLKGLPGRSGRRPAAHLPRSACPSEGGLRELPASRGESGNGMTSPGPRTARNDNRILLAYVEAFRGGPEPTGPAPGGAPRPPTELRHSHRPHEVLATVPFATLWRRRSRRIALRDEPDDPPQDLVSWATFAPASGPGRMGVVYEAEQISLREAGRAWCPVRCAIDPRACRKPSTEGPRPRCSTRRPSSARGRMARRPLRNAAHRRASLAADRRIVCSSRRAR